jgi:hypothetical protein
MTNNLLVKPISEIIQSYLCKKDTLYSWVKLMLEVISLFINRWRGYGTGVSLKGATLDHTYSWFWSMIYPPIFHTNCYQYVADMFVYITLTSSLYADDVNCILSLKNINIQEKNCIASINLINVWCTKIFLKLNINKTNFIKYISAHNRFVAPKPSLQLDTPSYLVHPPVFSLVFGSMKTLIGMIMLIIYVVNWDQVVLLWDDSVKRYL